MSWYPQKNKHLGNALVLAAATLYVYNPVHQDYKQLGSAVCLCVCGMCCWNVIKRVNVCACNHCSWCNNGSLYIWCLQCRRHETPAMNEVRTYPVWVLRLCYMFYYKFPTLSLFLFILHNINLCSIHSSPSHSSHSSSVVSSATISPLLPPSSCFFINYSFTMFNRSLTSISTLPLLNTHTCTCVLHMHHCQIYTMCVSCSSSLPLIQQLSYQLFDARFQMHRAACEYILDMNFLHSKKAPDFLQRIVSTETNSYLCLDSSLSLLCSFHLRFPTFFKITCDPSHFLLTRLTSWLLSFPTFMLALSLSRRLNRQLTLSFIHLRYKPTFLSTCTLISCPCTTSCVCHVTW